MVHQALKTLLDDDFVPAEIVLVDTFITDGNGPVFSYSDKDLGDPAEDRLIVVAVSMGSNVAVSDGFDTVEIDATVLDEVVVVPAVSYPQHFGIFSKLIPAGETGDLTITATALVHGCCGAIYAIYKAAPTATATEQNQDTPVDSARSETIDISRGGVAVAVTMLRTATATPDPAAWDGLTIGSDGRTASSGGVDYHHSTAYGAFEDEQADHLVKATSPNQAGTGGGIAVAAWGPPA